LKLDLYNIVVTLFAVVVSITVHEFAHAAMAVASGDDTPRRTGRISLNPMDHFDPVGFTMIALMCVMGFGIGWGKPVQVNPYNFRHPRRDDIRVSLAGVACNMLLAVICALVLRVAGRHLGDGIVGLLATLVSVNIGLAVFNLIPLPPLDGSHVLANLLPRDTGLRYARFGAQYGMLILILLLVTNALPLLIGPPIELLTGMLLGV